MGKRNKGNGETEQRKQDSRPKGTGEKIAGNKKADRCGLGSGPLKTGGGIGDEGRGAAGGG